MGVPEKCGEWVIAWSLGQIGKDWLDDYALPFGEGYFRCLYLQVHYNNPQIVTNTKPDYSGLAITYTTQSPTYDIGTIIMVPSFDSIKIPPLTPAYSMHTELPESCTNLLPHPIHLVQYFPHMHQLGQKIWLKHIRDGEEQPEIYRDEHFDYRRQQNFEINTTLLAGDKLEAHCTWNSLLYNKTDNTYGGEAAHQEMCFTSIKYYPAINHGKKPAFCGVKQGALFSGHWNGCWLSHNTIYCYNSP